MKKYIVTTETNLMSTARDILAHLESENGAEPWHPDWVYGYNLAAMDDNEADEILSHDPPVTGFRISTQHSQWSGRNLFHYTVFPSTGEAWVDYPLEFYVALFLKRNIPSRPAVVEIGIDFDTILGGMEIPKEERRRRRRDTTRVQRVGGTTK